MKKLLLIQLLLLFPFLIFAQQKAKGTVVDLSGKGLDAVTVTLNQNSKNITYALADSGQFILSYPAAGSYVITASLVGYKPVTVSVILPKDSLKIVMETDSRQLGVVTISASKPIIERKIDRITFNVESSIIASGGTAWAALAKAPGVQINADNSLSANKKSVQIYMDGKPLNISGDDLANYLQGLPANTVASIEVFSNPPANFDAEGGSVINIVSKKSKAQGLNVALNGGYTQATYSSYTGASTFNYRKDKLNIYGTYGYNEHQFGKVQDEYVTYTTPTSNSYWYSPGYNVFHSTSNNYRLGADYQLTNNQVLGFLVTATTRTGSVISNTPTTVTSNNHSALDSTLNSNGSTFSHSHRLDYNLNYNVKLDTTGKQLNVDLDYSPYYYAPNQYVNNTTYLPDGSLASNPYHIFTPTIQNINIYSGKLDYNYKAGKIWTLTSGLKYSSIQSSNSFDFYNVAGSEPIYIAANSNHFDYTENTAAAYTSLNGSFGKWTLEAGLRGEFTHTRGYSATLDSLNTRQYFKLFPTLFTTYDLNENNELQFTYSYRVDRPGYALLNPARHYANPYSYLVGNPGLQPAFVQDFELGYTYKKEFNITAYYTSTHDRFSNITVQDNVNDIFYDTFENLGLSLNAGLRLSAPFHPAAWWEMNTVIEEYYQQEKSTYLQGSYDYHKFAYDGSTTQSFTLDSKLGLKAEISAYYYSPSIQVIFKNGSNSEVDAGLKINVLNGQGTIKLAMNDIFFGNTYHESVSYLNQNNGFYQSNDTRNGTLTFSYRFGKNVAAARKRNTSDEEESKRAQ